MLKAGITGGIGSGKSIICRMFSLLGIPVYNADLSARKLIENNDPLKGALRALFGPATYGPDGKLNRTFLANLVFDSPALLEQMNALVHPYVRNDYQQWLHAKGDMEYTIFEAAILIETGIHQEMDAVILVDAPESLRIKRVMDRDQRTADEIKSIISRQWTSEMKRKFASFVVENDDHHLVIPQVLQIDKQLRQRIQSGITA